jgi:hypothetical protein
MPAPPPSVMRPVKLVKKSKSVDYDPTEGESTFKGVILPIILIAIGLIGRIALAASAHSSAAENLGLVICQMVLSVVVMLLGCATAASMMSLNFGPLGRAILKLCGVSLLSGAVGTAVVSADPRSGAAVNMSIIAWYAVVFCYIVLFLILSSVSVGIQESLLTMIIAIAMQLAVSFALGKGLEIGQPLALFFTR